MIGAESAAENTIPLAEVSQAEVLETQVVQIEDPGAIDPAHDRTGHPEPPPKVDPKPPRTNWRHLPQSQLLIENVASSGGAIGSLFVGTLGLIGAWFTPYAVINSVLGFGLAVWGLSSPQRKLALLGLLICLVGFAMPLAIAFFQFTPAPESPFEDSGF